MHAMGLVHGDLKPANCLLQSAKPTVGRPLTFIVKLADFGSACPAAPSQSTSPSLGTNGASRQPVPHGPEPLRCSLSPHHWEAAAAAADAWRGERPDQDLGQLPRRPGGGVQHCRTTPCRSWAQAARAGAPGALSGGMGCGGALSHAAPEVVAGQAASQAADVWSLGVLLWQLVSGEVPYVGMPAAQLLLRKARLARHVTSASSPPSLLPASCSAACPAAGLESDRLAACSLHSCRPDVGGEGWQHAASHLPDAACPPVEQAGQGSGSSCGHGDPGLPLPPLSPCHGSAPAPAAEPASAPAAAAAAAEPPLPAAAAEPLPAAAAAAVGSPARPWPVAGGGSSPELPAVTELLEQHGLLLPWPPRVPAAWWDLATACCHPWPHARPTMPQVLAAVSSLAAELS
ncbi:kinase-like domain-containing protein [Haematococcus lacustris]